MQLPCFKQLSGIESPMNNKLISTITAVAICCAGAAYAYIAISPNPRAHEITSFSVDHTHEANDTIGAPQHSGGTDQYGCHNGSVPYHCH